MHVIARSRIREFAARYPDAREWLENWWKIALKASWRNLAEVRQVYASADQVGRCLVFNCKGTKYRLMVRISYKNEHTKGTVLVKHFLTHAAYDKGTWKRSCT